MPDILASGQWREFSVSNRGALEIGLVAPVPATLEVVGTSSAPKYLGASRDAVAFPGRAVSAERPVIVRANVSSQEAFPGDCRGRGARLPHQGNPGGGPGQRPAPSAHVGG